MLDRRQPNSLYLSHPQKLLHQKKINAQLSKTRQGKWKIPTRSYIKMLTRHKTLSLALNLHMIDFINDLLLLSKRNRAMTICVADFLLGIKFRGLIKCPKYQAICIDFNQPSGVKRSTTRTKRARYTVALNQHLKKWTWWPFCKVKKMRRTVFFNVFFLFLMQIHLGIDCNCL